MGEFSYRRFLFRVLIPAVLLGMLLCCSRAFPQTARWVKVPTVRAQSGSGVVAEMVARLPNTSIMSGEDYVGGTHYLAHGLNNHARETYGRHDGLDNAAYLPGGWAFIAPEPRFTIRDVTSRTGIFLPGLSVPFRNWNQQPLYIFDELSAYTCGTISGIEAGQAQSKRTRMSYRFALVLMDHAKAVVALAGEGGYPHVAELAGFVERVEYIHGQIAQRMGGR